MNNYLLPDIVQRAEKANTIIIVGAGRTGRELCMDLLCKGIKAECFFDNDVRLYSQEIEGIPVTPYRKMEKYNCLYIIASVDFWLEMKAQLLNLGIARESIREYFLKGSYEYNKRLDSKYYANELKDKYESVMHQKLDLVNPQKFTEKIQWLTLNEQCVEKSIMADKLLAKEYVKRKIGEQYLFPYWGGWDSFEEINFDILPNEFVLKCNHGCGMNIVVRDKNQADYEIIKRDLDSWMRVNYAYCFLELHYKAIQPKIIAEQYISEIDGNLHDYKVHCFNGEPTFLQVIGDRKGHSGRQLVYDFDWVKQEWSFGDYPKYKDDLKQPSKLDELYRVCKILAKEWSYVRIDFYIINEQIFFGEMTFTPAGGFYLYNDDWTSEVDLMMGQRIQL